MTGNQPGEQWDADDFADQQANRCTTCGCWYGCRLGCPGDAETDNDPTKE